FAVVVVHAARVVADVLGGEGLDRHRVGDLREFGAQDGGEELPLAAEVVVHPLLVHAGGAGDAFDGGAVGAVQGELLDRGVQDLALRAFGVPRHPATTSNAGVAFGGPGYYGRTNANVGVGSEFPPMSRSAQAPPETPARRTGAHPADARTVGLLVGAAVFVLTQLYAAIPLLGPVGDDLGRDVTFALATCFSLCYATGFLIWGPVSDQYGRKKVMT